MVDLGSFDYVDQPSATTGINTADLSLYGNILFEMATGHTGSPSITEVNTVDLSPFVSVGEQGSGSNNVGNISVQGFYKMRAWRPGVTAFETWTSTWPSPVNPSGQPYVDLTIVAIKRPHILVGG
jgi:hypothetical protein